MTIFCRSFSAKLSPIGEEDEDVARERQKIVSGAGQGDILELRQLTKVRRKPRITGHSDEFKLEWMQKM